MTRASLRRGLPYRWWSTETGGAVLLALTIAAVAGGLLGAWVRWWA